MSERSPEEIGRALDKAYRKQYRDFFVALLVYGLACAAASLGIAHLWGTAAQVIAIPFFMLGGFAIGRWMA